MRTVGYPRPCSKWCHVCFCVRANCFTSQRKRIRDNKQPMEVRAGWRHVPSPSCMLPMCLQAVCQCPVLLGLSTEALGARVAALSRMLHQAQLPAQQPTLSSAGQQQGGGMQQAGLADTPGVSQPTLPLIRKQQREVGAGVEVRGMQGGGCGGYLSEAQRREVGAGDESRDVQGGWGAGCAPQASPGSKQRAVQLLLSFPHIARCSLPVVRACCAVQ